MDVEDIERVIIDALARERGCTAEEMKRELIGGGMDMPVDSLLAVEVLVRVEEAVGVRLPASPASGQALRSVAAFAQAMADAVERAGHGRPAAGGGLT